MRNDAASGIVAVIGAGVAGLAAAAALRRRGRAVVLIEASGRVGGRAYTTVPALLGAPFDHGAAWLHDADRNPLARLAAEYGDRTTDSASVRIDRTRLPGRFTTAAEQAAYRVAEDAFYQRTNEALAGPDTSLAEAVAPIATLPWLASVVGWEAPIIAAADASVLSLRDWHANALGGRNLDVAGGLGAFVLRRLLPMAGDVRLNTVATALRWDGPGVAVETSAGTIHAAACIVTVSTGILAAGRLRFTPALPVGVQAAIAGLPMGLLNKVALRAAGADRLDLPDSTGMDQCVAGIDAPTMASVVWPYGADHAICFLGGSHAAAMEAPGAAEDYVRGQWRALFGARADAAFRPGAVVTQWGQDPWALGSYAYAVPGQAGARAVLGQPLAGGRLIFAGEATRTDGLAGTVGGAFLAGEDAAAAVA